MTPRRRGDAENSSKQKELTVDQRGLSRIPQELPSEEIKDAKSKTFAYFVSFAVNLFLVAFQRFAGEMVERVRQYAKHNY